MTRPIPHVGRTVTQQRALDHYAQVAADAEAYRRELEEAQRIVAEHETEQLLERFRRFDMSGCAGIDREPPLPTGLELFDAFLQDMGASLAWIAAWGFFGWASAPYVVAGLRWLGWLA